MSSKLESDVYCRLQVYCRVYGVIHFTSPAGWLPVHRDQLRAQRSVTSMGKLYLYLDVAFRVGGSEEKEEEVSYWPTSLNVGLTLMIYW